MRWLALSLWRDTGPLAVGAYYLFVDGFATHSGTADVTITITP